MPILILWRSARKGERISLRQYRAGCGVIALLVAIPVISETHYVIFEEGLVFAAWNGDASQVDLLLRLGADPNCHEDNGGVPLEGAVTNDHPEVVRILLEHGADPNTTVSEGGSTVLQFARGNKLTEIVRLLKAAGAR